MAEMPLVVVIDDDAAVRESLMGPCSVPKAWR